MKLDLEELRKRAELDASAPEHGWARQAIALIDELAETRAKWREAKAVVDAHDTAATQAEAALANARSAAFEECKSALRDIGGRFAWDGFEEEALAALAALTKVKP